MDMILDETKTYREAKKKYIVESKCFNGDEFFYSYETDEFPAEELYNERRKILIRSDEFKNLYYVLKDNNNTFFYVKNKKKYILISLVDNTFLTTDDKLEVLPFKESKFFRCFERMDYLDKDNHQPIYKMI